MGPSRKRLTFDACGDSNSNCSLVEAENINFRPNKQKKLKIEIEFEFSMDVVIVLTEIGTKKYNQGLYKASEECCKQAWMALMFSNSNIDHITSEASTAVSDVSVSATTKDEESPAGEGNGQQQQQECASAPQQDTHQDEGIADESASRNSLEYDEGMRVYDCLLPLDKSLSIEEAAATVLYNIGQTYTQRRLYRDAMHWYQKSLQKFALLIKAVNFNSMKIVMNLHALGYCLYQGRNDDQAALVFQRALALVIDLNLGPIPLAATVNCVGVTLINKPPCNTDLAMDLFRKSLALFQSFDGGAGNNIIPIATILNNIGRAHYLRSEFEEATKIYTECLQLRIQALGMFSADVSATAYNLGRAFFQLGQSDDALTYHGDFLTIIRGITKDPMSKDLLVAYQGMAEVYHAKKDYKMSLHYYNEALKVQKELCGGKQRLNSASVEVAATLTVMGNIYCEVQDYKSALKVFRECLVVEKKIYRGTNSNHPNIMRTKTNIGLLYKQRGKFKKALVVYQKLYDRQKQALGEDDFVLAETLSSIGLMQYNLKQYAHSFDSYQEALRIQRLHLQGNATAASSIDGLQETNKVNTDDGEDDLDIASTLNSIGLILFKQSFWSLAKECFAASHKTKCNILGKNHHDVGMLWFNMGTVHFDSGEHDLAILMYEEALRIERRCLGFNHPDVVSALLNLGKVHELSGYIERAVKYYQEAVAIERQVEESSVRSVRVARVLNLLGNVYLQLGQTDKMMECYVEASRLYELIQISFSVDSLAIDGFKFYELSKTNPSSAPVA